MPNILPWHMPKRNTTKNNFMNIFMDCARGQLRLLCEQQFFLGKVGAKVRNWKRTNVEDISQPDLHLPLGDSQKQLVLLMENQPFKKENIDYRKHLAQMTSTPLERNWHMASELMDNSISDGEPTVLEELISTYESYRVRNGWFSDQEYIINFQFFLIRHARKLHVLQLVDWLVNPWIKWRAHFLNTFNAIKHGSYPAPVDQVEKIENDTRVRRENNFLNLRSSECKSDNS